MGTAKKLWRVTLIGHDEGFGPPGWVTYELASIGVDYRVANSWTPDEVVENSRGADLLMILAGRQLLTRHVIQQLDHCRAIVRVGVGLDNIDLDAATERGIIVANTPDAITEEMSDHVIALILAVIRNIALQDRLVRSNVWRDMAAAPRRRLCDTVLGLIGFGRVARAVVGKLKPWNMTILAYDPYVEAETIAAHDVCSTGLNDLLRKADVVSLHAALTDETHHLMGEHQFNQMRVGSVFINTARGTEVDEAALLRALETGRLAGAGLDVLEKEPPDTANPLLQLDNVVITSHVAAMSDIALDSMFRDGCLLVKQILADEIPESTVNPDVQRWWLELDH